MPDDLDPTEITLNDIDRALTTPIRLPGDIQVGMDDLRQALVTLGDENSDLKERLEKTEKRVRTIEILDELIEPMAWNAFYFMCIYCGVVGAMVVAHGLKLWGFELPDGVLQFLVGSTATTVIGLVGMVLTGVFIGARGRNGA